MRKRISIIISAVSMACLVAAPQLYADEKTEHDCIKCHQISKSDAQNILREGIPDAKVLEAGPGPVKGLWEVAFDSKGQKGIVYISFSKELVVSGAIFNLKTKTNLTSEKLYALNKIDLSQIPLGDAIVMGDKDAARKVIVFDDPE